MRGDASHDATHLQETAARLRTLNRLNRLVSSSLAYEEVLGAIARAASDITETPCVSFWVVDTPTRTIRIAAWSDPAMGRDFPTHPRQFGEGAIGLIAASGRPLHIPDVFAPDSLVTSRDWWRGHALTSFYGMPVSFGDTVLAVLALNGRAPFALGEEDQELLGSLVAQAAVAIRNAELFTQAEARRQTAEAAEARYRELFERNIAGILRTTASGRILDCNDALVRILGYPSREALMARNAGELYINPAEREPVVAALRSGDRLTNVEFHWWRANGRVVTVLANVAVVDDPVEGRILDGLLIDITDRDRLGAVEREAEALRAVARLANTAAHEINNPLAVIAGHLTLIEQRLKDNPDVAQRVEKARAACKRISEMIAQMSRITRLELSRDTPGLPPLLDLRRSSEEP
jgi:PAS domain S-box-containing protein